MSIYYGNFECLDDVVRNYEIKVSDLEGVEILFAMYSEGNCEGYSFVLFRRDGKLYEVNGSHCSCHGLEGQWEPEETFVEAILKRKTVTYDKELDEQLFNFLRSL